MPTVSHVTMIKLQKNVLVSSFISILHFYGLIRAIKELFSVYKMIFRLFFIIFLKYEINLLYYKYVKKIYISLIIIFNAYIFADDKSVDDMIDFIVQEQFIAQQEKSMINSWFSAMEPMGLDVNSEAFADFFYPILSEYLSGIAKKMPAVYKEIYSEDEILALYNFMSSEEGLSITNKQPLAMEKGMLVISEDLVKLQERLVIALQDPEVLQSLKKEN